MKTALALIMLAASGTATADQFVRGYTRSDGTYVQPHYRSNPDGNTFNNYSAPGNINPYTGDRGSTYQPPATPGFDYKDRQGTYNQRGF